MSLLSHENLLPLFVGDLFPQLYPLGLFHSVLTIVGNRLVMIWVLPIKEATVTRSARLIRLVGLRRFLRCYTVAGNFLHNMMVSHIAILCSRTNYRTTRNDIAPTCRTFT